MTEKRLSRRGSALLNMVRVRYYGHSLVSRMDWGDVEYYHGLGLSKSVHGGLELDETWFGSHDEVVDDVLFALSGYG